MSSYHGCRTLSRRFRLVLSSFLKSDGLPFANALSEEEIERAFEEEGVSPGPADEEEGTVYTPAVTLWAFLSQMLYRGEQRSCVAAVARVVVLLVALGRKPCSGNTGAYCRARARLPEKVLRRLTLRVAAGCEEAVPREWLWHGRHVKLVDGTTVSMPDTDANQAEYPQQTSQEPGLGFPIVRMVLLFSLATGMLCDLAMGPYQGKETGEPALFRELLDRLVEGDIVLADRFYCSYFMIALLMALGVDFVVRLHQARTADFRRGRHLGKADHVVSWIRPAKPEWMDQETYDRMPESIEVREVLVQVDQPGFRTKSLVVVTTLCDAEEYTAKEIAELYRSRWLAELDIRAIKITLDMDVLRCKTPEMVRRELWTHLLAYNLIRRSILQSAQASGLSPRELSFTAAMQAIAASWAIAALDDSRTLTLLVDAHLANLAGHRVGHRPNRVEPRAVKRRPKPHRLLTKPRAEVRAELLANAST
ncbi:MAG: IS4 family transposase [Anaerolineae bacterium]|nr:IS4 family transposase [Anaerolineae bacterium]